MKKLGLILGLLSFMGLLFVQAQETFPRNDVKDERDGAYAFTNATIIINEKEKIEKGTLLVKKGKIEGVGTTVSIPKGYTIIDLNGKYLYPSFIDMHTNYGLPKAERPRGGGGFGGAEQIQSKTIGAYNSNEAIKSHYNAAAEFSVDDKSADNMRQGGFGAVLTFRADGIARGSSALVSLCDNAANEALLKSPVAAHYSFNRGTSNQNYPRSMMGMISLLRQTYLDAEWFGSQTPRPFTDQSLEAWITLQKLPQIFDAGNWMNVLRADKIGDEFGVQYIIKGGTDAYQRVAEIKKTKASLIVGINFPDAYDVEDPIDAESVSIEDMLHWELAPTNLAVLEANGIPFALSMDGLKTAKDFMANLKKAIEHGLSKETAFKALTSIPAQLMGVQDMVGSLKKGMIANFLITDGEIFGDKTIIHENWVQGKPFRFAPLNVSDYSGKYTLSVGSTSYNMEISGTAGSQKAKLVINDSTDVDVKATFSPELLSLNFKPTPKGKNSIRLSGWTVGKGWKGRGQLEDGSWIDWSAERTGDLSTGDEKKKPEGAGKPKEELGKVIYPFIAFGTPTLPQQQTILIKNTTVWTNEKEGIIANTDVLLKDGKIAQIGKNLAAAGAMIIDGSGKHLTSGIIDEHTHVGGGGNEIATNSAMVRIGDQINPEDINIYRSLAGGVTAVQVLHGSSNPIGGQSALIKHRWGAAPEAMKIDGADEFIKFALGENVKRSSNANSVRYPQTRMGVEQVYVDAFSEAREYEKKWKQYNTLSSSEKAKAIKPRRDLAVEAILEILNKERFITCHSYVQSEINMLMNVADRFNFRINTFTHILEGYKVADKMAKHGVAASTFSDWWNYKWEVRYAIPYNATIMHREGVLTAINSDDANMGRRLNQEAAKSIKYGGISEEDAWKMVTLNPAKMLHLDKQMGSIKVGKDADVVLWTDHPLSVYARAEKTILDGAIYFDIQEDQQRRLAMQKERTRLIQKMIGEKKAGGPMQRRGSSQLIEMHCDDVLGESIFDKE
ncbi:MAG: amidohydrolase family protein [Saprospiraceae bacterium]